MERGSGRHVAHRGAPMTSGAGGPTIPDVSVGKRKRRRNEGGRPEPRGIRVGTDGGARVHSGALAPKLNMPGRGGAAD